MTPLDTIEHCSDKYEGCRVKTNCQRSLCFGSYGKCVFECPLHNILLSKVSGYICQLNAWIQDTHQCLFSTLVQLLIKFLNCRDLCYQQHTRPKQTSALQVHGMRSLGKEQVLKAGCGWSCLKVPLFISLTHSAWHTSSSLSSTSGRLASLL